MRGGATPLDTSPGNPANARQPGPRRRSAAPPANVDDSELEIQIIRRHRRHRTGRPWFLAAALLTVTGVILLGLSSVTERSVTPARAVVSRVTPGTPLVSARRVPEFLIEPVAARNLSAALAPIVGAAPAGTCVQYSDGRVAVAGHNSSTPLIPASNLKILTAVAAVELLGKDTRLSTRFMTDGKPTDGATVKGNLYMIGGGDPLLTSDAYAATLKFPGQPATDLEDVADKIVAAGIRRITGSVVGDAARYDNEHSVPTWPQRYFTQRQVGPLSALLVDDGWIIGQGPSPDPAQQAAATLTRLLADRGVVIDGPPTTGTAPAGAAPLLDVPSLTIGELAAQALTFSDNTTAELLLKEIGHQSGSGGSTRAGLDAVLAWAQKAGLPLDGITLVDGSGLSTDNRVTCAFLAATLALEGPDSPIAAGLAVPGKPGTLHDRFLQPPLRDAVRAKTGTLNGVTSLSGWLTTSSGRPVDFAILINVEGRAVSNADLALQGQILSAGLSYPQAPEISTVEPLPVAAPG